MGRKVTKCVQIYAYVGEGNRKDVRNAVEAAHKAAPGWGKRAAHNRAQIVYYMAENLELRRSEIAQRLSDITGKLQSDSRDMQSVLILFIEINHFSGRQLNDCLEEVDQATNRLFYWGAYADKYGGQVQETTLYGATVCIREPVGVVAIACPDEKPLLSFVSLIAPAIVRSNAVIVIPSEKNPIPGMIPNTQF